MNCIVIVEKNDNKIEKAINLCLNNEYALTGSVFSDNKNYSLIEIKGKNLPHSLINRNFLRSIA